MTKRILALIAVSIFIFSFTQPAFYTDAADGEAWASPLAIFLTGWMGLAAGSMACLAWLANPLFIFGVILFLKNKKLAAITCLTAMVCAGSFLFFHTILVSEAPTYAAIVAYKSGYWIWLTSMVFLSMAAIIYPYERPSAPVLRG